MSSPRICGMCLVNEIKNLKATNCRRCYLTFRFVPPNKGKKGLQTAWNKGIPSPFKGMKRDPEIGKKISAVKLAARRVHSAETRLKISISRKGKRAGSDNPAWAGGTSAKYRLGYYSVEYQNWRRLVFERDDYTCQACGERGGKLQVDHVMPKARFPQIQYEVLNGRVLCYNCHRGTETWGYKSRVPKTLIEELKLIETSI